VARRNIEPWFSAQAFPLANDTKRSQIAQSLPAQLTELRAKRAIEVYPCAEDGKHAFYMLTFRPGADLARLLPQVDGTAWDQP